MTNARSTGPAEHSSFEQDLAAYLLDALSTEERVSFETHLAGCERCRTDLDWLHPAIGALAASVPQVAAPRRLRRRTLAAVRADRSARLEMPSAPTWIGRLLPAPVAAGLAAVAVALAIGGGYLVGDSGPDTTTVPAEVASGRAVGSVGVLEINGSTATLAVQGLPRLRPRDVYQAWVQHADEIVPSNTFIVDREGNGAVSVPNAEEADRVMVTREPRGGSAVPSTEPLLVAELAES